MTLAALSWRAAAGAALLLLLQACGSDSPQPVVVDSGPGSDNTLKVSAAGELVGYMQQRLRLREAQRGSAVGAPAVSPTPGPPRSATPVQEAGVDEQDLLKSDGFHLYTLQAAVGASPRLQIHRRASDGSLSALPTLALPLPGTVDVSSAGLMLSDDGRTLALLAQTWEPLAMTASTPFPGSSGEARVVVQRLDVSDPATASAGTRISLQGMLVGSRRIGDALYVVTRHVPVLAVDQLPYDAAAQREAAIAGLTAAAVLPNRRVNDGPAQPLLNETDCFVNPDNASTSVETTSITVFDLRSPALAASTRCYAGGSEALYMSTTSLVLATTRYINTQPDGPVLAMMIPQDMHTDLHQFALGAGGVDYRGSASVPGHLGWDMARRPYRMSEHAGHLRVLTFTGSFGWAVPADADGTTPPSPATLTVLREDSATRSLKVVSALPNAQRPEPLGKPGEQVYAVRFAGARAYVVTFRRTDPLYVLDLADAADPRITAALEVPGFSEMLYPLNDGLLFGVGRDTDSQGRVSGLKMALFDVQDATQPRLLASTTMGGPWSDTALSFTPHGIDLFVDAGVARIALPVDLAQTASDGAVSWQRGLQRFDVALAAGTLQTLPLLGATFGAQSQDLGLDRSVQIEGDLYHLRSGSVTAYRWNQ
jgi:hypothetical protein